VIVERTRPKLANGCSFGAEPVNATSDGESKFA
jgi:hypothetical protein